MIAKTLLCVMLALSLAPAAGQTQEKRKDWWKDCPGPACPAREPIDSPAMDRLGPDRSQDGREGSKLRPKDALKNGDKALLRERAGTLER